jgi:hypothetical protein
MSDPQERLDEVQQEIDEARTKAEDDGLIPDPDHEQRYYESGDSARAKKEDDQNAAPG